MALTSSLDYTVWACSWTTPTEGNYDNYPAFVPLLRPPDNIANLYRQGNDVSGLLESSWQYYSSTVGSIPRSRRVYYNHWWQLDGMPSHKDQDDYYKNTPDGTTYTGTVTGYGDSTPVRFTSIWGLSGAAHGKQSFKQFLQRCSSNGLTFDYMFDDSEGYGWFNLGGNYNAYGGGFDANGIPNGLPNFLAVPDPRRTPSIVSDFRFNNPLYRNILNRTFSEEFLKQFKDISENQGENRTSQQILSYYTNVTSRTDFKAPWSPSAPQPDARFSMYAFQSASYIWNFGTLRKSILVDGIAESSTPNIRVSQTDVYPTNISEAKYTWDLNGHYFVRPTIPGYDACSHMYGDVSTQYIDTYGYTPSPQTDDERFKPKYGGTSLGPPQYYAFLKEVIKMRCMLRSDPNSYENFSCIVSEPSNGFGSRKLFLDTRMWKELMYHICVHGVKFFIGFFQSSGQATSGCSGLQQILDDWKTVSENNRTIPVSNQQGLPTELIERINLEEAATKGVISGGFIPSLGKWIWRLTAPYGVDNFTLSDPTQTDLQLNIQIPSDARGVWVVRNVPGKPSYVPGTTTQNNTTQSPVVVINSKPGTIVKSPLSKAPFNSRTFITEADLSPNPVFNTNTIPTAPAPNNTADYTVPLEPKNRMYVQFTFSPINSTPDDPTTLPGWNSWGRSVIATFQGERYSRTPNGGPWGSPNPASLSRAYPFEYDPVNPDSSSPWHNIIYEHVIEAYKWGTRSVKIFMPYGGFADSYALTFQEWKKTYTSTTDKRTCPARWKGFKEAIRALLEGTLRPPGKEPMSEPMNVCIYSPAIRGDQAYYGVRATALWESLGTTDAERDALFYSDYVDPFIDDMIAMKGRTPNSGKLHIVFDTIVGSATPNTLPSFRNKSFYRTDALEMSDWYVWNKVKNSGIPVYAEARTCKTLVDGGNSYRNDFAFEPSGCGYYWWLFTQKGDFCDLSKPEDIKYAFILEDSNFPLVVEQWDAYQPRLTSTFNGRTRKLYWSDTNQPGQVNYNTPHYAVWSLYSLSDNYRYYSNKASGTNTFRGVNLDTESNIALDGVKYLPYVTLESNDGEVDPFNNYWRIDAKLVGYRPLLNQQLWDSVVDIQDYGGYSNGLWSQQGRDFWDTTVRKNTFGEFITFLDDFSRNYAPNLPDWNGVTYGFDPVALGTIHYV